MAYLIVHVSFMFRLTYQTMYSQTQLALLLTHEHPQMIGSAIFHVVIKNSTLLAGFKYPLKDHKHNDVLEIDKLQLKL